MSVIQLAFAGLVDPRGTFRALRDRETPLPGLLAVLTRFIVTSFTTVLALRELQARPFAAPGITLFDPAHYYSAEFYFLPFFGLAIWQLMSAFAATVLALRGAAVSFVRVLNIFGIAMLIPMPLVWIWDWTMIASGSYTMGIMAVSHTGFQLWETWLDAVAINLCFETKLPLAAAIAIGANALYVLTAMIFVR